MPRDAFALKIQRELCHPKYAQRVSGLSRNGPLVSKYLVLLATELFAITQRLFTKLHDFLILLELIHGHKVVILYNLKRNQSCIISL